MTQNDAISGDRSAREPTSPEASTQARTTEERLRQLLVDHYRMDPARLTPQASFEALGLDSLGVTELLFYIEDEFNLKLPPDVAPLPTLQAAVQYVDGLLAAEQAAPERLP